MRKGKMHIKRNSHSVIIRAALLIVTIVMILAGIANGGMKDVYVKAVNICTECIGLE